MMWDLTYVLGIGGIMSMVLIEKFCEMFGFKNAVGLLKITLPYAAFISLLGVIGSFL